MAENFSQIPPNSTGEKIRLFKNTVGLNDVNSEAMTVTDQTGQVMKNMGANGRIYVDASEVAIPVTDNSGSLTVDAPVTTPVFVRLSDGAAAITALPVTDNGGSLTVDGTVAATQSGTWTVQPGNTANTTPWLTTNTPGTSGGYLISKLITAATTNPTSVKASAGQLYGYFIYNDANQTRYVKLHNTAGAPTAGTGVVMTIGIPAGGAANVEFTNGIAFSTGIAFTTVTGITEASSVAVGANELAINLFYK